MKHVIAEASNGMFRPIRMIVLSEYSSPSLLGVDHLNLNYESLVESSGHSSRRSVPYWPWLKGEIDAILHLPRARDEREQWRGPVTAWANHHKGQLPHGPITARGSYRMVQSPQGPRLVGT